MPCGIIGNSYFTPFARQHRLFRPFRRSATAGCHSIRYDKRLTAIIGKNKAMYLLHAFLYVTKVIQVRLFKMEYRAILYRVSSPLFLTIRSRRKCKK